MMESDGLPSMEEIGDSIRELVEKAEQYRPIDPSPTVPKNCPFCAHDVLVEVNSRLGKYQCNECKVKFDVQSGIGGVRHLRSFIVITSEGPKLVIGPQHLEHMLESDEMEIPAAGWFGNASVGMCHALDMGEIPSVELDDLGIAIEDMQVILITSSIWHHKQYAKASGYFLHYHPDEVFSEIRRADTFMATKLGLSLDVSDKQMNAILQAFLDRDWDTVKTAARMSSSAVRKWAAGDSAAVPTEDEEDDWDITWKWGVGISLLLIFCVFITLLVLGVIPIA